MKNSFFKRTMQFVKPYKFTFINLFICVIVTSFVGMLYPYIFKILIDEVFYHRNMAFFKVVVITYGVAFIGENLLHLILNTTWAYLTTRFLFDIRKKIFDKILSLKAQYLTNSKTGDLIARLNTDTDEFMNLIHWNIFYLIANILRFIVAVVIVGFISLKLVLVMFVVVPISVYVTLYFGRLIKPKFKEYRKTYGNYISWVFELIKGMREVQLLAGERSVTRKFVGYWSKLINLKIKANLTELASERTIAFISLASDLTLYVVSGILIFKGELTIGGFIAVIEYFKIASKQLAKLSQANLNIQKNVVAIQKVFDILDEDVEEDNKFAPELRVTAGQIEYRDAYFSYNQKKNVLKGVNLALKPGEKVAIVGQSGAGKSTLVNMLLRLYDPDAGQILIDGVNIKDCSLKSVRKNIGIVQQEILMFNGTIRHNLRLGNRKASDTEMWEACEKASIAEVIRNLPDGLNTVIGKNGVDLSGGQKQRLAIARIFLKNPSILIFDEATSALDHEAEKAVQLAWEELSRGRTSVIIAHRLSTIIDSDRIAVLEDGKIIGFDNHQNLLKNCAVYKRLFEEQYLGQEGRAV